MGTHDSKLLAGALMVLAVLIMAAIPKVFPQPGQAIVVMGVAFVLGGLASLMFMELNR